MTCPILGVSLQCLRAFLVDARHDAGYQFDKPQRELQPDGFKPMPAVGRGVEEIRMRDVWGVYRVLYIARYPKAAFVLYAFQKKTLRTSARDIELARTRLREASKDRR